MMIKCMRKCGIGIGGFFLLLVLVFASWAGHIASAYNLSYGKAGNFLARSLVLSAIEVGCKIYDPWTQEQKITLMGPDYSQLEIDIEKAERVDNYLRVKAQELNADIIAIDNQKHIIGQYPFFYEMPNPRLQELREKMGLDGIVANAKDELEELVLLRNWVRTRFRRVDYQKRPNSFDALRLLQNIQINNEGYEPTSEHMRPCETFPRLFIQTALSMGFQVRFCQISEKGVGRHGLTEVWSNQFNKWITMDVDLNLIYMKQGIPQNLVEIHHAAQSNDNEVNIFQEIVDPEFQPTAGLEWMYNYHRYVNIADMRNDWLSRFYFPGHPKQSYNSYLGWLDEGEGKPFVFLFKSTTSNKDDFYWSLNRTEILVNQYSDTSKNTKKIPLVFNTITPNFSRFDIEVDGENHSQKGATYTWELHPGTNSIKVWSVNDYGRRGVVSEVKIAMN